jgi:PEGA domain-containing protein
MSRLLAITIFVTILCPCFAQPQDADPLGAALDNARRRIEGTKPGLSRQTLDADRLAVQASRDKVYSLYAMRRWTSDQMSAALAARWVQLRTGEYAVPSDWSLDGIVVARYGLCVEAAMESITIDEFLAEGEKVVAMDSVDTWFPPAEKHKAAIAGVARQQVSEARSRGLNVADAYSVVLAALTDLAFEPGDELLVSRRSGSEHQIRLAYMSTDQFRAVPRDYWLLTIDSLPAHATITVDGEQWGSAKKGSYVSLGPHMITIESSGYQRLQRGFDVTNDPDKNIFTAALKK